MYREHVAYTGVGVAHVPCGSEDTPLPQTGRAAAARRAPRAQNRLRPGSALSERMSPNLLGRKTPQSKCFRPLDFLKDPLNEGKISALKNIIQTTGSPGWGKWRRSCGAHTTNVTVILTGQCFSTFCRYSYPQRKTI